MTNIIRNITVILLFTFLQLSTSAQEKIVLNNKSVISIAKTGINNKEIIKHISNSDTKFKTSTEDLVKLKKSDVPSEVIATMVLHQYRLDNAALYEAMGNTAKYQSFYSDYLESFAMTSDGMVDGRDKSKPYLTVNFPNKTEAEIHAYITSALKESADYYPIATQQSSDNSVITVIGYTHEMFSTVMKKNYDQWHYTIRIECRDNEMRFEVLDCFYPTSSKEELKAKVSIKDYVSFAYNKEGELKTWGKRGNRRILDDMLHYFNSYIKSLSGRKYSI